MQTFKNLLFLVMLGAILTGQSAAGQWSQFDIPIPNSMDLQSVSALEGTDVYVVGAGMVNGVMTSAVIKMGADAHPQMPKPSVLELFTNIVLNAIDVNDKHAYVACGQLVTSGETVLIRYQPGSAFFGHEIVHFAGDLAVAIARERFFLFGNLDDNRRTVYSASSYSLGTALSSAILSVPVIVAASANGFSSISLAAENQKDQQYSVWTYSNNFTSHIGNFPQGFVVTDMEHFLPDVQPDVLYAVGSRNVGGQTMGQIYFTLNGGASWELIHEEAGHVLTCISFSRDGLLGMVGSSEGMVLRTTDGGIQWEGEVVMEGPVNDVRAVSTLLGFAVGDKGTFLRYQNGPSTVPQFANALPTVQLRYSPNGVRFFNETQVSDGEKTVLAMYDMLGRQVFHKEFWGAEAFLHREECVLPSGMYMYELQIRGRRHSGQLVW